MMIHDPSSLKLLFGLLALIWAIRSSLRVKGLHLKAYSEVRR
jgi:hypothetical protein